MKKSAMLATAFCFTAAVAAEYPRVDADLEACDQHIAQLRQEFANKPPAPQDKEWVKAKLRHMVDIDEHLRGMTGTPARRKYTDEERIEFNEQLAGRLAAIDRQNTAELEELLKTYPWPTIREGQCSGPGTWEPLPVEEPEELDARRPQVGLESEEEYQKLLAAVCHESVEETIGRAIEEAKKKYGRVTPLTPN